MSMSFQCRHCYYWGYAKMEKFTAERGCLDVKTRT